MIIQTQAFWASVLVPDRPLTLITFISPNRAQVSFKHSIAVSQEAAPCQQRRARETLPPAVNANIDIWRSTKEMEGEWAASRHTFLLAIIMWNVKSFLSSTTKSIFVNTKEYDWPDLCNGPRVKPSRTKNISQYENDLRSIFSLSDKAAHMIEVPQSRTDVIPGHGWHRTGPVEDGGRSTPTHSALRCDPSFPNRTMMRRPCALVKQKTRRLTSNNKHMLIWNNTDLQAHKLNNHIFCKRKKKNRRRCPGSRLSSLRVEQAAASTASAAKALQQWPATGRTTTCSLWRHNGVSSLAHPHAGIAESIWNKCHILRISVLPFTNQKVSRIQRHDGMCEEGHCISQNRSSMTCLWHHEHVIIRQDSASAS